MKDLILQMPFAKVIELRHDTGVQMYVLLSAASRKLVSY